MKLLTLRMQRSLLLYLAAVIGLAMVCGCAFVVHKRCEPVIPREVTLSLTLLCGVLYVADLLLIRKLCRFGVPKQGVVDFYLMTGAALLFGIVWPFYHLVRMLVG